LSHSAHPGFTSQRFIASPAAPQTWVVIRQGWRLPMPVALGATGIFHAVDLLLVAGCAAKQI
jgi:hypothetical protein